MVKTNGKVKKNGIESSSRRPGRKVALLLIATFATLHLIKWTEQTQQSQSRGEQQQAERESMINKQRAQQEAARQREALAFQLRSLTRLEAMHQLIIGMKGRIAEGQQARHSEAENTLTLSPKTIELSKATASSAEEVFKKVEKELADIDQKAKTFKPPNKKLIESLGDTRRALAEAFSQANDLYVSVQIVEAFRESVSLALFFTESEPVIASFEDRILLMGGPSSTTSDLDKIKRDIKDFTAAQEAVCKRAEGVRVLLKTSNKEDWRRFIEQIRADIKSLVDMKQGIERGLALAEDSAHKP